MEEGDVIEIKLEQYKVGTDIDMYKIDVDSHNFLDVTSVLEDPDGSLTILLEANQDIASLSGKGSSVTVSVEGTSTGTTEVGYDIDTVKLNGVEMGVWETNDDVLFKVTNTDADIII